MRLNDLLLGALVLAAGIAILVSAYGFSSIPGQDYGADTMPKAIGLCTIALGLFLAGRALWSGQYRPTLELAEWTRSPGALFGMALTLALVAIYVLASPRLGFLPVAFLVVFTLMLARRVRLLLAAPVAAVATVLIHEAFARLLLVPLPRGEFAGLLW